jgi:tRNA1(Val) A37 N6-methylase TrmN6
MKTIIYQSPTGYRYNSDSIFLYDFATNFKIKGNVLDIGCGVGILSLLLAKDFNANFYAVEKQESMYKYALKNFKVNKKNINLELNDFKNYNPDIKFDFIISNPPFYIVDKHQSPNLSLNIARYEHNLPLDLLISKSSKLLKNRGYFIFCYDASYLDKILILLHQNKINPEFLKFVHSKADKEAKIVMIASRKNSKAVCKILPPLITFKNGNYSKEAKEAFLKANTHSIKAIYDI